jgi:activating signal cointegrator complex subunit 1
MVFIALPYPIVRQQTFCTFTAPTKHWSVIGRLWFPSQPLYWGQFVNLTPSAYILSSFRKYAHHTAHLNMGKKTVRGEYNDFLDGEKLRDNADIRISLQGASQGRDISPPATRQEKKGWGKRGRGGPKIPQLTHFLCLPLVDEASRPQLETGLAQLKQELEKSGLVPLKAVRPVGTLHLTLGVMSLDANALEKAKQHLQGLNLQNTLRDISARIVAEKAAEQGAVAENLNAAALPDMEALSVELKGLLPMQKPSQTSILYVEPRDGEDRLYAFGSELRDQFTKRGFLVEDKRALRLHATVINTIYAKPKGRGGKQRGMTGREKGLEQKGRADTVPEPIDVQDDGASTAGSTQDADEIPTAVVEASPPEGSTLDGSTGHGPNATGWRIFDARDLIERYKEVVWAKDVRIDRVQICRMGAKKVLDADGEVLGEEYEVVAEKVL